MRKVFACTALFLALLAACQNSTLTNSAFVGQETDSLFFHTEDEIEQAFSSSFALGNMDSLVRLEKKLQAFDGPLAAYWRGYIAYLQGIYLFSKNKRDSSSLYIDRGIEVLKNEKQSSESSALLGMLYNFSVQFSSNVMIPVISHKADSYFQQSLALDSNNLRSYLGMANKDYYTPEKFGGKKNVNGLLQQALTKPDRLDKDARLPSWGREQAYELLIRHHVESGEVDAAKTYYKEAVALFPMNYQLIRLSSLFLE
ncbi:tetratricopeptide repeat protein [Sphingobacterium griseoflavum]|uniref:Tetratricopeptide repeat protein n=1 Tax=Sphingobacterium griseoflavum TaxID=1474952 RepID=A0ABQ3HWT7_9SPHI|nr:hypothetical protein [Sphingobacterium griseoflavum]GHE28797.1 hypothetical protein GCM10017764_09200 [Sphingobacterium griseoflavum]